MSNPSNGPQNPLILLGVLNADIVTGAPTRRPVNVAHFFNANASRLDVPPYAGYAAQHR